MDDLSNDDIAALMHDVGADQYMQQVISLFMSHRATQAQWLAMAEAVLHVSESEDGAMVACIDRAILEHMRRSHA